MRKCLFHAFIAILAHAGGRKQGWTLCAILHYIEQNPRGEAFAGELHKLCCPCCTSPLLGMQREECASSRALIQMP